MRLTFFALVIACTHFACITHPAVDPPLQIGLASTDITPPIGYRLAGYYYERLATAVHDPLFAKAIVFKQGDTRFALVICDLCHTSPAVVAQARALAAEKTGIPADQIAVCATHTHTGPDYFGPLADHLHELAIAAHNGEDPARTIDYPQFLANRIAQVIADANSAAVPSELAVGVATQENLAFNRRYVMKDGTFAWNPGKKNPKIDRPAGPIDPHVSVLSVTRYRYQGVSGYVQRLDSLDAILTSFPLHPDTVGGTEYSADFPHYLEEALRVRREPAGVRISPHLLSIFAQGTSGNINHVNVASDDPQKGHEEARRIGTALARYVSGVLPTLQKIQSPRLAVASTRAELPLQQYTPDEVASARALFAKIQDKKLPFLVGVRAVKIVKIYDRYHGQPIPAQIQALRLSNDAAIVLFPSELFVEFGLSIKQRSPFPHTFVIELANDSFGYVPTKKAFEEGNYEPTNATIAPGGGEQMVEAALQLLNQLK
jgi:hypothetical protein